MSGDSNAPWQVSYWLCRWESLRGAVLNTHQDRSSIVTYTRYNSRTAHVIYQWKMYGSVFQRVKTCRALEALLVWGTYCPLKLTHVYNWPSIIMGTKTHSSTWNSFYRVQSCERHHRDFSLCIRVPTPYSKTFNNYLLPGLVTLFADPPSGAWNIFNLACIVRILPPVTSLNLNGSLI